MKTLPANYIFKKNNFIFGEGMGVGGGESVLIVLKTHNLHELSKTVTSFNLTSDDVKIKLEVQ